MPTRDVPVTAKVRGLSGKLAGLAFPVCDWCWLPRRLASHPPQPPADRADLDPRRASTPDPSHHPGSAADPVPARRNSARLLKLVA